MIVMPANTQKALMARMLDIDPMKKAKQSVIDVIVMDGPACIMPRLILSRDDKW